jgi:hypothetical protein
LFVFPARADAAIRSEALTIPIRFLDIFILDSLSDLFTFGRHTCVGLPEQEVEI